jgi:hypothetical protein
MWRILVLALSLSLTAGFGQAQVETKTAKSAVVQREADLSRAVEKQELRHYDLHRYFIPVTQGNLQWLAMTVGARPDEAVLVWKLMREWDSSRGERTPKNPT